MVNMTYGHTDRYHGPALWLLGRAGTNWKLQDWLGKVAPRLRLWRRDNGPPRRIEGWQAQGVSRLLSSSARATRHAAQSGLARDEAAMPEPQSHCLSALWRAGHYGLPRVGHLRTLRRLGLAQWLSRRPTDRQNGQRRRIFAIKLPLRHASGKYGKPWVLAPLACLSLAGCISAGPIVATPSACSSLVPESWASGVAGAHLPDGSTVGDWIAFGDAQTGRLDVANGRQADTVGIISRCESRDREAVKRSRPRFLGLF